MTDLLQRVHPSWREDLSQSLAELPAEYRRFLAKGEYLPGRERLFAAFESLPKEKVRYVLFGQDPYPRSESAIGYAFIDGAVDRIFGEKGFSKPVNRATSLRNFLKMALVADGRLKCENLRADAVAQVDKKDLVETMRQLRENFERNGVLLLNAALVFESKELSSRHAKIWVPFLRRFLSTLPKKTELILFGSVAKKIMTLKESDKFKSHSMEHPYNHTFACNEKAIELFGPMRLLRRREADPQG